MATLAVFLHGKEVTSIRLESGREYTFGRGENCDVQLQDQPGVSRQHFKVSAEAGSWTASVVSKFGELSLAGRTVSSVDLSTDQVFKLAGYEFRFSEDVDSSLSTAPPSTDDEPQSPSTALSVVQNADKNSPQSFQGNDEATNVGVILPGRPSLRIVKKDGTETRVELEGKKWLAGREETCDIFLPDRKASRRQFELSSTPDGYFITDLGSANGTVLNGDPLIPEQPRAIQSGDILSVQSLRMHFEIYDPTFEKRLVAIPQELLAAPNLPAVARFEIVNYPTESHGGAVRVDPAWGDGQGGPPKSNTLRLALVLIIAVGALYAIFGQDEKAPVEKPSSVKTDALSRLTPQQRQLAKELYVTARNLHMQSKFENAHEQLKKLHELLPEGYEQSKAMEEDCLQRRAQMEQLAFAMQEKNRIEEQKRLIDRNIRECNAVANTSYNLDQIRGCLAPTIGADPSNPLVADLVGRVESRINARNAKLAEQRDYASRVIKGSDLYRRAVDLQAQSDWYAAIDAFNRHIESPYPDPDKLKAKSQAAITGIQNMLVQKVDELLAVAQSAYQAKNFKDAIEAAKKAKSFDPRGEKAPEFIGKVRRELNSLLKPVYEDAILHEGVGQVSAAQTKWRQILERDTADGEYYLKSKIKLRNYSEQGQ